MSPATSFATERAARQGGAAGVAGRLRMALLLALILAIPLQSLAGVLKAFCGAAYHGTAEQTIGIAGAVETHGSHEPGQHEHPTAISADKSCSYCMACCGAAALPSGLATMDAVPGASPSFSRFYRVEGFVGDTPDRPPRLSLA